MAFGNVVDSFSDSGEHDCGVVFGTDVATPTTGNLMLLVLGDRNNGTVAPSGWTEMYSIDPWSASSSTRTVIYAKVATTSESDLYFYIGNARPACLYYEIEGPFESLAGLAILEHTGHAEGNVFKTSGLQPGSSGTLSQADTFALVVTAYRGLANDQTPTGISVDSGFTAGEYDGWGRTSNNYTYALLSAYKVTTSTASLNPTITWTTGDGTIFTSLSALVVLKKAGGIPPSGVVMPVLSDNIHTAVFGGQVVRS